MNQNQRIAMAEKDLSVRELSEKLNRTPQHISNVLGGRFKSFALRREIANILDRTENYLWPEQQTQ
jgi:transcriptional regulator with XRE-family HTH domain